MPRSVALEAAAHPIWILVNNSGLLLLGLLVIRKTVPVPGLKGDVRASLKLASSSLSIANKRCAPKRRSLHERMGPQLFVWVPTFQETHEYVFDSRFLFRRISSLVRMEQSVCG